MAGLSDWLIRERVRKRAAEAQVDSDSNALISAFADQAYYAARQLERTETAEAGHWALVAVEIARRSGRQVGLDTATRFHL